MSFSVGVVAGMGITAVITAWIIAAQSPLPLREEREAAAGARAAYLRALRRDLANEIGRRDLAALRAIYAQMIADENVYTNATPAARQRALADLAETFPTVDAFDFIGGLSPCTPSESAHWFRTTAELAERLRQIAAYHVLMALIDPHWHGHPASIASECDDLRAIARIEDTRFAARVRTAVLPFSDAFRRRGDDETFQTDEVRVTFVTYSLGRVAKVHLKRTGEHAIWRVSRRGPPAVLRSDATYERQQSLAALPPYHRDGVMFPNQRD